MDGSSDNGDEVAPLELFFDLVFVFAVSQLSGHLLANLTWRGAAETATLLIAVFSVWSATSWSASLPGMGRRTEAISIVAVMPLGLFMNAAVGSAFAAGPWAFVVPFLICHLGTGLGMLVLARTPLLREHFGVQFAWLLATGVLWCLGAAASPDNRLAWWVAAAAIDLTGSWTAHRLPWRRLQSRAVEISPDHMVERSRLLLIIALGEAILATGTAIAGAEAAILTTVSGALALTCVALLWAIYFAGSDRLVSEKASTTDDPLGLARIAVNSQVLNLASLIAVAVATDLAIAAPTTVSGTALVLLLFGGLWIFIATQSWYLRRLTGRHSPARLAVLAAIPVVGALCSAAPAWATLTAAAASLGGLALAMLVGSRRPDQLTPAAG